jgi:SulP family sulfate permease
MNTNLSKLTERIGQNWKSGVTVALVSLPLSVSIAVASGATPVMGIITAIWGGLIASIFASSNYNIMGPAGALTAILAMHALSYGPSTLPTLAIMSGIMILVAYLLRLDRYIGYIPSSVVHGFTLSVAIVLVLNQLNFAFGLTGLPKHGHFLANVGESLKNLHLADPATVGFFLLSLGFLFLCLRMYPKVPGAIIIAPIAIVIGWLGTLGVLPFSLMTLGDVYPDLSLALFSIPQFAFQSAFVLPAATVALVAILETEISAKIADGMTNTKHSRSKETLGLGLANVVSGFFGGLPATGVFVRTSLNVRSGATHRVSCGINAIVIAIISLVLLNWFRFIPLAAIAAILVYAAIRMVEAHHFKRMWRADRFGLGIALGVAAIAVYEDAMIGILAGTVVALILLVERMSKGQFELIVNTRERGITERVTGEGSHSIRHEGHAVVYSIKGHLTYINAQTHAERITQLLQKFDAVVLRLRETTAIDLDGDDAVDEIVHEAHKLGKRVLITGINKLVSKQLEHSKGFNAVRTKGDVYAHASEALRALGYPIKDGAVEERARLSADGVSVGAMSV